MIRIFQHGDHEAIATIYYRAVHEIACSEYNAAQCRAWAGEKPNPERWKRRCEFKRPFVFVENGEIAGFLELDTDGHIDCAYINPDFKRRGIMSRLIQHAVETSFSFGLSRLYVDASICAMPVFQKAGFAIVCEKSVTIRGVELKNFEMEKKRKEDGPHADPTAQSGRQ